jgi:hypothetical protein
MGEPLWHARGTLRRHAGALRGTRADGPPVALGPWLGFRASRHGLKPVCVASALLKSGCLPAAPAGLSRAAGYGAFGIQVRGKRGAVDLACGAAQNATCFAFAGWSTLAPWADSTASPSNARCASEAGAALGGGCGGDAVLSAYEPFDRWGRAGQGRLMGMCREVRYPPVLGSCLADTGIGPSLVPRYRGLPSSRVCVSM